VRKKFAMDYGALECFLSGEAKAVRSATRAILSIIRGKMLKTLERNPVSVAKFSTAQFMYFGDQMLFSQEASSLNIRPGSQMPLVIDLKSAKTGTVMSFNFKETLYDPDEREFNEDVEVELAGWEYVCMEEGFRKMKLIIWND